MNLKIKLLQLPARGNHLIVIASGIIDPAELEQILRQVEEETQAVRDCKILIDLDTADLRVEPVHLHGAFRTLAANLSHRSIKMALCLRQEQMRIGSICCELTCAVQA